MSSVARLETGVDSSKWRFDAPVPSNATGTSLTVLTARASVLEFESDTAAGSTEVTFADEDLARFLVREFREVHMEPKARVRATARISGTRRPGPTALGLEEM